MTLQNLGSKIGSPPADGSETVIQGDCGVDVTGSGTAADPYGLTADLVDIIGASGFNSPSNGLIVVPLVVEPGQCRHIEVAPGTGIQILNEEVAVTDDVRTEHASVDKSNDAAASTVTSEQPFFINDYGVILTLLSVTFINGNTLAGNDTVNFTLTISRRDSAGVQTTVVAYTNDVASGGVTAWVAKSLGALGPTTTLADGDALTYTIAKNGGGQQLGKMNITVTFTVPG